MDGDVVSEILGERDTWNSVVGSFPDGSHGAGDGDVVAQVSSVVDAGKYECWLKGESEERHADAVGRGAGDGVKVVGLSVDFQRGICGDAMADLRLFLGRGDDDDAFVGKRELGGSPQCEKSFRLEAVVVSEQNHSNAWRQNRGRAGRQPENT